ncbi:MAG TPA: Zn-ribbon domain-containing OB-fold protein [Candidatus Binatia bacterium]|nr:Zn-ribbon domain-containing OB-fold protein [Candidatus Binatia bacterium]
MSAAASSPKSRRPIVPFLRLPDGAEPHLVGQRCTGCGAVYLGDRRACSKCTRPGPFEEIPLSRRGTVWVWSIVHQSMPGVPVPYAVGIVDLPEGVSVRCNLVDVEPDPAQLRFGMPVEMTTGVSQQDRDGNDVVAFYFRPVRG